jgi:succinate dehydrogenase / fumarate reductase flavoprotein subunit
MSRYDPDRLELSTRDRVALAIATEIREGRGTPRNAVNLSLAHVVPETIAERLPRMLAQFRAVGVDITREPMEVAPTAHYSMGGVRVQPETHATTVPGLFAAGEVTAGVHGANRLGGNSLVECIVFGCIAASAAADWSLGCGDPALDPVQVADALCPLVEGAADPAAAPVLAAELRALMWSNAGLLRDGSGLHDAASRIDDLHHRSRALGGGALRGHALAAALDLPNLILTARVTALSALARTESRGAHQRTDYPNADPTWLRNIICRIENGHLLLHAEPVPAASAELAAAIRDAGRIPVVHHGLE